MPASRALRLLLTLTLPLLGCDPAGSDTTSASTTVVAPASGRVELTVTADGFVPSRIKTRAGQPLTLAVTRRVDVTCATEVVIKEHGINQPLPKDETVLVSLTPAKPGTLRFACAMDMIAGEIVVE